MIQSTTRPITAQTRRPSSKILRLFGRFYLILIFSMGLVDLVDMNAHAQEKTLKDTASISKSSSSGPPGSLDRVPIPHNRGFWKTLLFWFGGFFCMYLVARRMFKEQIHEHRTLKRLRDEIGEFFPEFSLANLKKWVDRASEHVYMGYQTGQFSSMKQFSTDHFQSKFNLESDQASFFPKSTLNYIIKVHPLGAYLLPEETVPPKGVEIILRIEQSVNTPYEKKGKTM